MGDEGGEEIFGVNNINAAVAHVILTCVAGHGMSNYYGRCYTDPGVHLNCFAHGLLGIFYYQSASINVNVNRPFRISTIATKYLPIPCLNADLYRYNEAMSLIHILSGVIPFYLAVIGKENRALGRLVIAGNIISMAYYSFDRNYHWGYYTAAAAFFTYYIAPTMSPSMSYPLGLAMVEYCSYRLFWIML